MNLLAKTFEGLERVLAHEIESLGGENVKILTRAVSFTGDERLMYKANYMLRTALRILVIKKEFEVRDSDQLYRTLYRFPWDHVISVKDTFAVDATVSGEVFTHSKFTALKVKDAIVDKIRDVKGERPNVNIFTPNYRINIHIRNTTATLSYDTSGESLHMRGYRIAAVDAPLNEVMAAGLVLLSGWDKSTSLLDPMCGSGTILIEADRIARNLSPHSETRTFGFKKWSSFKPQLFKEVVEECNSEVKESSVKLIGYDKNLRAIKVSEQNIEEAKVNNVTVIKQDFFKSTSNGTKFTIITNPPYDLRLRENDILKFYKNIGDQLKKEFNKSVAWIFSGNIEALKSIGLKPSQKINLMNGGLEAKMYKFDMYVGTKD